MKFVSATPQYRPMPGEADAGVAAPDDPDAGE
jgi:hypothetical protein